MMSPQEWRDISVSLMARWRPRGFFVREASPTAPWVPEKYDIWFRMRLIRLPYLNSERAAATMLHEFGHYHLGHAKRRLWLHEREFEAWVWALMALRLEGLQPTRALRDWIAHLMRHHIALDNDDDVPIGQKPWDFLIEMQSR